MKTRIFICTAAILLFNSCIVNSLFPFFTEDTISFEKTFLGIWDDNDSRWIINSVEDCYAYERERDTTPPSKKELDFYNTYKNSYYATLKMKEINKVSIFVATPFKIDNQLFLDFIPFYHDDKGLASHHFVPTHSLAKFEILGNNNIEIKWLSSEKVAKLFENNRIKIKHEKVGASKDKYLLTASSEELQKFIKKYMTSNDDNKWKTDVELNLKRNNLKESPLELMLKAIDNSNTNIW